MLTEDGGDDGCFHHGGTEDTEDGGHRGTATASNAEDAEDDNGRPRVNGNVKVLPFSAIFAPSALRAFRLICVHLRPRRIAPDQRRALARPASAVSKPLSFVLTSVDLR